MNLYRITIRYPAQDNRKVVYYEPNKKYALMLGGLEAGAIKEVAKAVIPDDAWEVIKTSNAA